ncbi:MAG: glycosyltransferase family 2 protein [Candidatus Acidiferrales bacterium]
MARIAASVSSHAIPDSAAPAAAAAARPRLTVIVPVHNGRLQLPRCLDALLVSDYTNFEVIVADDCSTDNTREIAEGFGARYVRTARNMGPGGARNLAARHAEGDILAFVDSDVVVPPEALGVIAEDFDRDPDLASLFGSYDTEPAWPDFLSQYKNLMHHYVHQISKEDASTFWAGCGAIRREVFTEFGGFDLKKYPKPSIEDIELGFRMWRAGRRILLEKRLQVKHLKKWTVRGLLRADILLRAVPWTRLILQSKSLPRDLNLTHAAQASAVLSWLLAIALLALPTVAAGLLTGIAPWLTATRLALAVLFIIAALLVLNREVYAWFVRQRGWRFAAGAVLAHWAYYLYSAAVFGVLWIEHVLTQPWRARAGKPAQPTKLSEESQK